MANQRLAVNLNPIYENRMQLQETLQVKITSTRGQIANGSVEIRKWQKRDRMMRGLKALGICWTIMIPAIFIPIFHFILVPLLLLAGPIAFFLMSSQEQIILGGKGECPECKKNFDIVRSSVRWPLSDICNHCHNQVKIEL